jgi:nucleotide-binding universal stress UspA family protein
MSLVQDAQSPAQTAEPVSGLRSIMVHVETSPETLPRLHVAVDLARKFDAALLGVGVEAFPMALEAERVVPGETVLELQKILDDDLGRAEEIFRAHSAGLRAEWRAVATLPGPAIARLSRAADLIVAGGAPLSHGASYRAADTADLAMQSGRPVLVAPPTGGRFHGDAALVAWKDTREARRAIADAMSFLKRAEEVLVVEVCAEEEVADAQAHTADVVRYLQRHQVPARAKVLIAPPEGAADALTHQARNLDADLIVAGAYGHSRLGEWAFGGVTRALLHSTDHFVLLSH